MTLHAGDVVRVHYNLDEEPRHAAAVDRDAVAMSAGPVAKAVRP